MTHTVFSIVAPVDHARVPLLRQHLTAGHGSGQFPLPLRITPGTLPTLHFASMVVFDGQPLENGDRTMGYLVLECCVDGRIAPFLDALVGLDAAQASGPQTRGPLAEAFTHCADFNAGAPNPGYLREYFAAHIHRPHLHHIGVPGMRLTHIAAGRELRSAVDQELDAMVAAGASQDEPLEILKRLRTRLNVPSPAGAALHFSKSGWFADPESLRWSRLKHWTGFAVLLLAIFAIPIWAGLRWGFWASLLALVAEGVLLKIFLWWLHGRDSSPITLCAENLADLKQQEDFGPLNHMATFTLLQPGSARAGAARLVLGTLERVYRTVFTDVTPGRLNGLSTIHFAHWTLVPVHDAANRPLGRNALMFLSNYDGSWEAYLDDFIDLMADGVAAIWGNCIGFRWPMHGPTFKAFARNGMTPWQCWYAAEPHVTVPNIHNNDAIRKGLLAALTADQARVWLSRLGSLKTGHEQIAAPSDTVHVADVQGLVLSGYGHLPHSSHVPLRMTSVPHTRDWLEALCARITDGRSVPRELRKPTAVNVAFTWRGLVRLGLPEATAHAFPLVFQQGIAPDPDHHRSRALGDVGENDPSRWVWGGSDDDREVDLLLILYAASPEELQSLKQQVLVPFTHRCGIEVAAPIDGRFIESQARGRSKRLPAEHFGFVDGLSQPLLEGTWNVSRSDRHPENDIIKPGEVVLGYQAEDGRTTPGIPVAARHDPGDLLPDLPATPHHDFGRNGSFLVARQMRQNVVAFRQFTAAASSMGSGHAASVGAQVVGRSASGVPLALNVAEASNNFTFADDPHGFHCPIGAHARRANPRGSLGDDLAVSLKAGRRRRLLRRGRTYGKPLPPDAIADDDGERGMMFVCLNSDIERQFEFVQQNWIRSSVFGGLYDEADPLLGAHPAGGHVLTVQANGIRSRLTCADQFVTVQGGDYFFLPGLRALRYLASLNRSSVALTPRVPPPPAPSTAIHVPAPIRVPFAAAAAARVMRLLPMLSLAMALRFQILCAAALVLLGFAAHSGSPLRLFALSFFLSNHWSGVILVAMAASLAASVVMITTRLTLMYGARIGLSPRWVTPVRWRHVFAFQLLAVPVVVAAIHWTAIDGSWVPGPVGNSRLYWSEVSGLVGPALLGFALGLAFLSVAAWVQRRNPDARPALMFPSGTLSAIVGARGVWRRPPSRTSGWASRFRHVIVRNVPPELGTGYIDYETQRVLPGHAYAMALAALSILVYGLGYVVLSPFWSWSLAGRIPSIAYLLLLLIVAGWAFSALAFFLDRYRLSAPLFVIAVLAMTANSARTDHYYRIGSPVPSGAAPLDALAAAQQYHPDARGTVVVMAEGYGLVSSAWTAHVLTELAKRRGQGAAFVDAVRLVSASSGSSLAALHFVNAYEPKSFRFGDLDAIRDRARSPSSGEGGWGFVYPELLRTVVPFAVPKFVDRGWAMEQAWKRNLGGPEPFLSTWRSDVAQGWRPATAFGATVVETGKHALVATYRHNQVDLTANHDVSMVTAARLSAAFPLISPSARPAEPPNGGVVHGYHAIDSGVTDNSGWTAARAWLDAIGGGVEPSCVLLVRIRSAPRAAERAAADRAAWTFDLRAPLEAMLTARAGDAARVSSAIDDYAERWQQQGRGILHRAEFALDDDAVPLSWNLGRAETVRLQSAWQRARNQANADKVATFLTTSPETCR